MLTSYPVRCPYDDCRTRDDLIPSRLPGGPVADFQWGEKGWFRCRRCGRDWPAEIRHERVLPLEILASPPA